MKKSIQAVVAAVVVALAVVNVYKAQPKVELSDFQIKNVEALANQELIGSLIHWTGSNWVCFEKVRDDMYDEFFLCTECDGCINTTASYVNDSDYCLY